MSAVDLLIVYLLGLFAAPALPRGRVRRAFELLYAPLTWLGLWYRWSMYAPDAPEATQIAVVGVVDEEGTFEIVSLDGLEDSSAFGKANGLREIAYQWALCDPMTDHLKPELCWKVLAMWRELNGSRRRAVAVEVRSFRYPAPPVGASQADLPPDAVVETIWSEPVTNAEDPA